MAIAVTSALLVQAEEHYTIRRLSARVVIPQENGELHNASWGFHGDPFREFDGFEVTAYLGESRMSSVTDDGRIWGFGTGYAPHRVQSAEQARAIASVLGRVERYSERLNQSEGYIKDSDFHRYLLRVAAAVRIRTFYVRNLPLVQERSGEMYRKVDGSSLQYWLDDVASLASHGKYAEIGLRS